MLTFFRRIRKGLLGSDATRKPASPAGRYILYAAGEVLLVMIGILLALQVNNWNEEQKRLKQETVLLELLKKEIKNNVENLQGAIEINDDIIKKCEKFLMDAKDGMITLTVDKSNNIFDYGSWKAKTPILDETLETDSRSLITNLHHIELFRDLKEEYNSIEYHDSFLDEFYNFENYKILYFQWIG